MCCLFCLDSRMFQKKGARVLWLSRLYSFRMLFCLPNMFQNRYAMTSNFWPKIRFVKFWNQRHSGLAQVFHYTKLRFWKKYIFFLEFFLFSILRVTVKIDSDRKVLHDMRSLYMASPGLPWTPWQRGHPDEAETHPHFLSFNSFRSFMRSC